MLIEAMACCMQGGEGGEEGRDGKPGLEEGEGSDPGRASPSIVCRQHPGIDGMLVGPTAPVRGGGEVEEPEGGVEGERGGEDEGGEGVALCKSVEGEEPASTRADFALKLIHQS